MTCANYSNGFLGELFPEHQRENNEILKLVKTYRYYQIVSLRKEYRI